VSDLIPLEFLSAGEVAKVAALGGAPEQVQRLHEMGFRVGVLVEVISAGSPCIIRLAGHKLGFRADDLHQVLVRVEAAA